MKKEKEDEELIIPVSDGAEVYDEKEDEVK